MLEPFNTISNFWHYKRLLWDLVKQDFRSRYAGSVLGVFWNILQPAAQVFIFAVLLAKIIGAKLPADAVERLGNVNDPFAMSIYICSGLLAWIVFNETVMRNSTAFLAHRELIKKVAFPHPLLVLYQVISGIITLAIMLVIFIAVILATGPCIGWSIIWLPVVLLVQALFMYGLGLLLATIGIDAMGAVPRFAFGTLQLQRGIEFIPMMIGIWEYS